MESFRGDCGYVLTIGVVYVGFKVVYLYGGFVTEDVFVRVAFVYVGL